MESGCCARSHLADPAERIGTGIDRFSGACQIRCSAIRDSRNPDGRVPVDEFAPQTGTALACVLGRSRMIGVSN